jgi:2-phosphoglycerate kinase
MNQPKVFLVGGAPGAGKTTLGRALAARLGKASLSLDDVFSAVLAVTTRESHPGLHAMGGRTAAEYFTTTEVEQLQADATLQHEAMWPPAQKVIRNHATWGSPMVIDGWFLRPDRVARLDLERVRPLWLVVDPPVLEARERANAGFFGNAVDPERMLRNFLARSLWFNDLIAREAGALGMKILRQDGSASVDDLCARALD